MNFDFILMVLKNNLKNITISFDVKDSKICVSIFKDCKKLCEKCFDVKKVYSINEFIDIFKN
jgi:hypothetical protein